ncbi:taurine catabolism dioxygenase TauD [Pigmentiphaga sp. NML080357]|uniref:TauD/TfdA dioxygenase family protein n=1 Tax=Pigmentiphaga sp. NML080357 TaxID=2008675 RepID=UPI000B40F064|nr:TauD/TfdA family dioxygenase [Pigmentiphaga sp. NML080357]OVZ57607.1 taurine catabolism dioxygenase TauD [Pigmentiphaga sp. NML080357]
MQATPLSPLIGAAIRGVDLGNLDDATYDRIYQAFLDHQLLVFKDQALSPARQLAFSRRLGPLDIHVLSQYNHPEYPEIFVLSNEVKNGVPAGIADGGSYWHSDFAFREKPAKATILNAQVIPPEGGNTLFVNMYRAYDDLDDETRSRLEGQRAVHRYRPRRDKTDDGTRVVMDRAQLAQTPDVVHPIVRTHPETGRRALFVHPGMTAEIVGWPEEESRRMLDYLFAHCTQESYQYALQWSPGDVVMWDNRCVMHKATTRDLPAHLKRTILRTTVLGDRPV